MATSAQAPVKQASAGEGDKAKEGGNVRVFCRFRPLNEKELARGEDKVSNQFIKFHDDATVQVFGTNSTGNAGANKFNYDRVFDMGATQSQLYEHAVKPIVMSVMDGFNGTVFAYGQTSSGKTHTMLGPNIVDEQERGMIPRMVSHIFTEIENAPPTISFEVKVSYVEVYMERVRDLCNPSAQDLKIRERKGKSIYIENVTEFSISDEAQVYQIMAQGHSNRAIGATEMNSRSSRSHSCFIVTVQKTDTQTFSQQTGQLYLVDLAGSERSDKTGATGKQLDEANTINKSLTNLGKVINMLTDNKGMLPPYRDSKLTRILQESLGGNSKTSLIITCSPAKYNLEETLGTLRFGARAKRVKNKAKVNKELTIQEVQALYDNEKRENAYLKRKVLKLELRNRALEKLLKQNGIDPPIQSQDTLDEDIIPEEPVEEVKQGDISDQLLAQAMKTAAYSPASMDMMLAELPTKHSGDQETQTEAEYPTATEAEVREVIKTVEVPVEVEVIKEVIREVEIEKEIIREIVREVHHKEDSDKIDDTDISTDDNGRYRIFSMVSNPDDIETEDSLTTEFSQRTKISQIKILLAEVKHHLSQTDEAFIKIDYIKKLYAEQLKKLLNSQRTLHEKELELEIKTLEIEQRDNLIKEQDDGNNENVSVFRQQEVLQGERMSKLQDQIKGLKDELEAQREQLTTEYAEMERLMKLKLLEAQNKSKQRVEQMQMALDKKKLDEIAQKKRTEKMEHALEKQQTEIESVIAFNESMSSDNQSLKDTVVTLKADLTKEKLKRNEIITSLDSTGADKVRTSQRLNIQDKEMDRMNMLYRQIASEKAALNREKELLAEKIERKREKHVDTKQQLEEVTQQFERTRDENTQYGQIIAQVMVQIKSGGANTSNLTDFRQSLQRLSTQQANTGGLFGSQNHFSGLQGNQTLNPNRNSNMRVVLRGGAGSSVTLKGGNNRVSQSMHMTGADAEAQALELGFGQPNGSIREVKQINDLLNQSGKKQ